MEQNTEQNKETRKAKITIEIEGQETEVIETEFFTLIADQGTYTQTMTMCNKTNAARIANHIRATENNLKDIMRKAPEAAALVMLMKAAKQVNVAETEKDKAQEE